MSRSSSWLTSTYAEKFKELEFTKWPLKFKSIILDENTHSNNENLRDLKNLFTREIHDDIKVLSRSRNLEKFAYNFGLEGKSCS